MKKVCRDAAYATLIVVLAFMSVVYAGCKKEEPTSPDDGCSSVVCQNGGTCFRGKCTCPIGYEGDLCERKSSDKYIGKWEWEETVTSSSVQSAIGTKRSYNITITQTNNLPYVLNVSDFRGNVNFDDVLWRLGWQYIAGDDGVETETFASPTQFIFSKMQVLKGSRISIERGSGSLNELGTFMSGTYEISEPDSTGKVYKETCEFKAAIMP